jgi:hypothetical protein
MDVNEYLAKNHISLDEVVAKTDLAVHLVPGDILFMSGSLVEALGNDKSDLDLFLLTSRHDIDFTACLNDVAIVVGDCLVDIRVVQHAAMSQLIDRFRDWARKPRQPRRSFEFVEDERKLLYRLKIGQSLYGHEQFEYLQNQISLVDLARHKLDWSRHLASTIQIDLAGLQGDGDHLSMVFAAQELLGYAIDGLLAGHGFSNPNNKWRVRYLSKLPESWEYQLPGRKIGQTAVDQFISLHRIPEVLTNVAISNYSLRIAAFSRVVFTWAEHTLLAPGKSRALSWKPKMIIEDNTKIFPYLALDVELRYGNEGFEIVRLNDTGTGFRISDEAYLLLCLFDGETPKSSAASKSNLLDEMMTLVKYAQFEAESIIDDEKLQAILTSL